eukprot:13169535-Ditylum_brightwellii.AAC.1
MECSIGGIGVHSGSGREQPVCEALIQGTVGGCCQKGEALLFACLAIAFPEGRDISPDVCTGEHQDSGSDVWPVCVRVDNCLCGMGLLWGGGWCDVVEQVDLTRNIVDHASSVEECPQ